MSSEMTPQPQMTAIDSATMRLHESLRDREHGGAMVKALGVMTIGLTSFGILVGSGVFHFAGELQSLAQFGEKRADVGARSGTITKVWPDFKLAITGVEGTMTADAEIVQGAPLPFGKTQDIAMKGSTFSGVLRERIYVDSDNVTSVYDPKTGKTDITFPEGSLSTEIYPRDAIDVNRFTTRSSVTAWAADTLDGFFNSVTNDLTILPYWKKKSDKANNFVDGLAYLQAVDYMSRKCTPLVWTDANREKAEKHVAEVFSTMLGNTAAEVKGEVATPDKITVHFPKTSDWSNQYTKERDNLTKAKTTKSDTLRITLTDKKDSACTVLPTAELDKAPGTGSANE